MTNDEFRAAIAQLWPGHGGQTRAAEYLDVASSRVREWIRGTRNIPAGVADDMRQMCARFPHGVKSVDPVATLKILHQQMVDFGFSPPEAAAGVLGAAISVTRPVLGQEMIEDLLRDAPA